MKIEVDYKRCEGHGLCEDQAPDVFELDDEGDLIYQFEGQDVPAEHQTAAARGAAACPVAALRVVQ
ncbi:MULTISPECIES: ferredoxin [Modestobacter]|uniref:Ferredoxin n=1 Tax=Modestobacter caceresii TaxID=1522368 RepID=A0A098Y3V6_9ACTN|nr:MULTISPECIES: ferredoxin [Modestobacter]KGH43272.1 ferredoxin [Modestobacter caceresii]MCZ2824610.1 ferredoxin [Modestobacter sp. VKM Ac-2981]MCZ2853862.1 ferredoxin [Modestobacter sp. VKM Ac-2982]